MNIEHYGQNAIVEIEDLVFSFEVSENPRDFEQNRKTGHSDSLEWSDGSNQHRIDNWRILPYGDNNDLPKIIKNTVQNNSRVPGMMKKRTGMLWGKGPKLYREKFDDKFQLIREWTSDKEIEAWMKSWDAEAYLMRACVDYNHIEGVFTKFYRNRAGRVDGNKNQIAKLEHITPDKARLAARIELAELIPTHVILNDWRLNHLDHITGFKVYKLFDFQDPFAEKNAIHYSNMYSFCTDYYTVPDIYGSLEWIRRSTAVPLILKALSKHSINAKYHIESPQKFWDEKKEVIEGNCERLKKNYDDSMLQEFKTAYLKKFAKALAGEINSGKFIHTVKQVYVDGTDVIEQGWSIKPIDENTKDFVDSQLKIGESADRAVAAAVGLGTSLGNVGKDGAANSGSERLYALQDYMMSGIDISETIVMKALNYAIQANFPETDLKCGFYHTTAKREEDVTESKRVKNLDT